MLLLPKQKRSGKPTRPPYNQNAQLGEPISSNNNAKAAPSLSVPAGLAKIEAAWPANS